MCNYLPSEGIKLKNKFMEAQFTTYLLSMPTAIVGNQVSSDCKQGWKG